ncbi:unnamed protein product [Choristocarpus tenellus]
MGSSALCPSLPRGWQLLVLNLAVYLMLMPPNARGIVESDRGIETLVFEDSFEDFDLSVWKHELTLSGGGNWQFEYSTNNRSNSWVEDGVLYLQPTLTSDTIGDDCFSGERSCSLSMWGLTPPDQCTSNAYYGCERQSNAAQRIIINPVQSAKIYTAESLHVTYGRIEIEAKLPVGDWIWPAIWMLPAHNSYGSWPSSGEIDIVESRGNSPRYFPGALFSGGHDTMSSTLHWGPYPALNRYHLTTGDFSLPSRESFGDRFHTFGLSWDETGLYTYVDSDDERVLSVSFDQDFWTKGGFSDTEGINNPWRGRGPSAPFDRDFYLIMNVAVGGVNGFFPDNVGAKPWTDHDTDAALKFWEARESWLPTWKGLDSALQVLHVAFSWKAIIPCLGTSSYGRKRMICTFVCMYICFQFKSRFL